MPPKSPLAQLAESDRVFRGTTAVNAGISREVLAHARSRGVITRLLPDTYRFAAVPDSDETRLRAALLWAGDDAAAAGRSAGAVYGLENVRTGRPEIVVSRRRSPRHPDVDTLSTRNAASLMVRS